jgi:hypothetical protein
MSRDRLGKSLFNKGIEIHAFFFSTDDDLPMKVRGNAKVKASREGFIGIFA